MLIVCANAAFTSSIASIVYHVVSLQYALKAAQSVFTLALVCIRTSVIYRFTYIRRKVGLSFSCLSQ